MKLISRKEAGRAGLPRYFTGKPCKRGHIAERHVANGQCLDCHAQSQSKRQRIERKTANPRSDRPRRIKPRALLISSGDRLVWFEDKVLQSISAAREWEKDHPMQLRQRDKAWRKAHPEQTRAQRKAAKAQYRTRLQKNGGKCSSRDVLFLYRTQKGRCANCGSTEKLHLDHIKPVVLGGSSDKANLQLLCGSCNRAKSAKDPIAWAQEQGRLL